MTTPSDDSTAPHQRLDVCWFFIPLPEPLGLPDGWNVRTLSEPDLEAESSLGSNIVHSMRVHQLPLDPEDTQHASSRTFELATNILTDRAAHGKRLGRLLASVQKRFRTTRAELRRATKRLRGSARDSSSQLTVLEVAIPARRAGQLASPSDIFDHAVEAIRHLQHCYAAVLQRPARLVTRQQLPLAVPMLNGYVLEDGGLPQFDGLSMFLTGLEATASFARHPKLSEQQLSSLQVALETLGPGGEAFSAYADLRNEAWCQLHRDGNIRLAALTTGVSGEVFADTLLLHLLWEEGTTPDDAAQLFNSKRDFKARLLSEYHSRLGGTWADDETSTVGRYVQHVLHLRNRIAHGGYFPTMHEVNLAQQTMSEFEIFVGDQLTSPVVRKRFPRTAIKWIGVDGIKRRGAWTKTLANLVSDESEPNWMHMHHAWRSHFQRMRGYGIAPGTSPEAFRAFFEFHPDGTERFLLHDVASLMATQIDGKLIATPDQLENMRVLKRKIRENPANHVIRAVVRVDFNKVVLPPNILWLPDYEVLPELAVNGIGFSR